MDDPLDEIMSSATLRPSPDFIGRVMQRISHTSRTHRSPNWLAWAAAVTGVILGISQLASFMFGMWIAVAAG